MYRNRRFRKSKNSILISIISLSFLFCLSLGYSSLRENLEMGIGVKFSPTPKLKATTSSDTSAFRSDTYKTKIKTITFEDEINISDDAIESWDIGVAGNGNVMAYVTNNETDSAYYDLYIQSDSQLYANQDMSYWFSGLTNVDSINGLELLDTSMTTNMNSMFRETGYNSSSFALDVSHFDTSEVTDMSFMFYKTGVASTVLKINVSGFDTGKVENMNNMFRETGYNNPNFTLDVSHFDTSKVIDMSNMFYNTGYNSTVFNIDLSRFDFTSVTNVDNMLYYAGYNSAVLDTSLTINSPNISSYSNMFYGVATKGKSKIIVYYDENTEELVDLMIATKTSNSNVIKGGTLLGIENVAVGDYVYIDTEMFNVISFTDEKVTLLAAYALDSDYRQAMSASSAVSFADQGGWEYTPGPEDIDIQVWSTNPKLYVNEYVAYIQSYLGLDNISGDLITLQELGKLDCDVPTEYDWIGTHTCADSKYTWLVNLQSWWTRSAYSGNEAMVWVVNANGYQSNHMVTGTARIRPTITIPRDVISTNSDKIIISRKDS